MRTGLTIQTTATLALLSSFLAAEAVAFLLNAMPTSTFLWFLALEVFRPFYLSGATFEAATGGGLTPGWIFVLAAVALFAHWLRVRIIVGFFANLSSAFMLAVTYQTAFPRGKMTASIAPVGMSFGMESLFLWFLLALTVTGALVSHYFFLQRDRAD